MKIRNFVFGMLTCAAFTACTNEDIVDNNGGGKLEGEAYASVNILAPTGTNTRAIGDDDFEAGEKDENEVSKATFLFFDGAGNNCATAEKTDLKWKDGTGSIAKISIPVLVLDPITGTIPTSVIAILNPIGTLADFTGKTLSQVKDLIGKEEAYKTGFMMSNSVYALNGATVAEVALSSKNVSTEQATAIANPVQIPVERVVAKVKVTGLDTKSLDQTITIDNKTVTVNAVIKGWKITATNPDSYLVKQVNPSWTFTWDNVGSWNNPVNFRSYWAVSATPEKYNYYSYNNAIGNATVDTEYCLENAGIAETGTPVATNTLLWAVAQLQDKEGNGVDFMQWRGSKYSVDGVKTLMANMLQKYYYKNGEKYVTISKDQLEFKKGEKQYQVLAELVEGTTFYNLNADGTINLTDKTTELKAEIAAFVPVLHWKDGMTYYYTAINHDYTNNSPIPGIVRNHVYKMTINSITGLGTPVPDEGEPIIPTKPETDEDSYLAAQVQVLKWKIVNQSVDLN